MMMNMNMKIKVKEEEREHKQMQGESSVDEEENDHLPISQLFQLLQQRHRRPLHSSSTPMEIHDYPQKAARCKRKMPTDKHSNDHVVRALPAVKRKAEEAWAKSSVIERAEEVQANLSAEFPSFFKIMIPSIVCRGFWMSLPKEFCQFNLPSHDTTVTLVDESGKEYRINFLVQRRALSGGWKKFSTEHSLLVGDALVFHLIRPSKFKVYIVRVNGLAEVDAALGLLRLENSAKQTGIRKNSSKPFPQDIDQYEVHSNSLSYLRAEENQSENGSLDIGSSEVEGIRSSPELNAEFKQLRGTEKFTILVNGLALDSTLSERLRKKYYELCCSQKSFLHENLHKNINCTLAADIIIETVKIADAIRASMSSTSQADFVARENTLSGFEFMGMDVGFLRNRVQRLLTLAFESKTEERKYKEAKLEKAYAEREARSLELELLVKKKEMHRLDAEVQALKVNAKRHKLMFEAAANAPW
ncbi:B3 domain-containing protein Os01g0234100-like [Durio zibethinus]|uniref:B3 domain-containing protein Os01g0234100-like n=1 Tax=Durio zibethinus TaxID=66656 RepID=A0A6P6AC10_DURZI|nr:B3 domain-containing protein Os01g0234100-like [Durio zibethinus]